MYCKYCGNRIADNASFCSKCGRQIIRPGQARHTGKSDARQNKAMQQHERMVAEEQHREIAPTHVRDDTDVPKQVRKQGKGGIRIILRLIYIIVLICGVLYATNPDNNILNIKNMRRAYALSQEVILDELVSPSSAVFPKFDPEFVTQRTTPITYEGIEFNVHTVTAYVDADNIFGASMRYRFVVEIGLPKDSDINNYYYRVVSLE